MKVDDPLLDDYSRVVVVDTNVLISAALAPHGVPAALVDHLLAEHRLVFSETTFTELETRFQKPKFVGYLSMDRRQRLLQQLSASSLWFEIPPDIAKPGFSRDASGSVSSVAAALVAMGNLKPACASPDRTGF